MFKQLRAERWPAQTEAAKFAEAIDQQRWCGLGYGKLNDSHSTIAPGSNVQFTAPCDIDSPFLCSHTRIRRGVSKYLVHTSTGPASTIKSGYSLYIQIFGAPMRSQEYKQAFTAGV